MILCLIHKSKEQRNYRVLVFVAQIFRYALKRERTKETEDTNVDERSCWNEERIRAEGGAGV